jgi:PAS domain S-box-containing protein
MREFYPPLWKRVLPDLAGLLVLAFIGWCVYLAINTPFDGAAIVSRDWAIEEVDKKVAGNPYHKGDVILSVNGMPASVYAMDFSSMGIGEQLDVVIFREGQVMPLEITLVRPTLYEMVTRLSSIAVAFIFWLIGVSILLLKPVEQDLPLFFAFFQAAALALAAGSASSIGPRWTVGLWVVMLWVISPVTLHFHLHFPQRVFSRIHPSLIETVYGVATVGVIGSVVREFPLFRFNLAYDFLSIVGRAYLVVCLLGSVGLLFYSYRHPVAPGARGKIRLIALGGAMSLLPFILMGVVPDMLSLPMVLPYPFVFLLLMIWGMTYGYAILRPSLIKVEHYVRLITAQILVVIVFGSIIFLTLAVAHWSGIFRQIQAPVIGTFIVLMMVVMFVSIRPWLFRIVTATFYGSWYDYRSVAENLTKGLEHFVEIVPLTGEVSRRLVKILGLQSAGVALRDGRGSGYVFETYPATVKNMELNQRLNVFSEGDLSCLAQISSKGKEQWVKGITAGALPPEIRNLLKDGIQLWIPITGREELQGVILLGNKRQGDVFSEEDIDLLRLLARQMGTVTENINLLRELREHAAELESRVEMRTAELFDAKERVEAILASVGDGVLVTDLAGTILTANAAFQLKSGYESSEVVGNELSMLFDSHNDLGVVEGMQTAIANGQAWSGELISRNKNGETYDVLWTIAPLRDRAGQITGYVGSQQDISRKKEIDRAREQFIANVSHDLRTPISTVCLYLDLLEGSTPEMHPKLLGVLKGQSYLLRGMVEDILDFDLLLQQKKRGVEFETVELDQLTAEIVTAQATQAEMTGIQLSFSKPDCSSQVWGEPKQLARMIFNLVANAIRYTPAGGKVQVCIDQEGDMISLEVCDTGIGIDEVDMPHIFDRFYRGHNVRQSHKVGTGLGLAIVDEVVKLHQGKIEVESKVEAGSCFRILLHAYNE